MSRSEVRNISTRAFERRRAELDSHRAPLRRTLRDAPAIDDAIDVFGTRERTRHSPPKSGD